jgi:hypothetical protein
MISISSQGLCGEEDFSGPERRKPEPPDRIKGNLRVEQ